MKYIFLLFILALTVTGTSCKKSGPGKPAAPDTTVPFPIYINASINGVTWNADSSIGNLITYPNDSERYNLSFTATKIVNGVGTEMDLYITNYTGVGSYVINPPAVTATYYVNAVRHFATSGQIDIDTVRSIDTVIGDFNFVADSITVTNGAISMVL
jgi:hypothetical protein